MVEISGRTFATTKIIMSKTLVEKIINMHEQMGNFSREMETLTKKEMKMLEIKKKSTLTEIRMPSMGSSVYLTQPGMESMNLKMGQQK